MAISNAIYQLNNLGTVSTIIWLVLGITSALVESLFAMVTYSILTDYTSYTGLNWVSAD